MADTPSSGEWHDLERRAELQDPDRERASRPRPAGSGRLRGRVLTIVRRYLAVRRAIQTGMLAILSTFLVGIGVALVVTAEPELRGAAMFLGGLFGFLGIFLWVNLRKHARMARDLARGSESIRLRELERSRAVTRRHLASARGALSAAGLDESVEVATALRDHEDLVDHGELERAMDMLEVAVGEQAAPEDFWRHLGLAAESMGLDERAEQLADEIRRRGAI